LLQLLDGGVDSPVAIAVGTSEGTRAPDGGKTSAWDGHIDPGNGVRNQGSFSYQHSATSPNDADEQQLKKIKNVVLPKFLAIIPRLQKWEMNEIKLLFLLVCDLYTQSETACVAKGGFLSQISMNGNYSPTVSRITDWRVQAYYDPDTGNLDAPGFSNNAGILTNDQKRRTEAIFLAAKKLMIYQS
jgi:hypothetical protein